MTNPEPEELHDLTELDFHLVGSQPDRSVPRYAEPDKSSPRPTNPPAPARRPTAASRPIRLETAVTSHDRLFLLIEGVEHGPFELADLQRMAAAGRLREHHQVRQGDDANWLPLPQKAAELGIDADRLQDPALVALHQAGAQRAAAKAVPSTAEPQPSLAAPASAAGGLLEQLAAAEGLDAAVFPDQSQPSKLRPSRWSVEANPAAWICLCLAALLLLALAIGWLFFTASDGEYYAAIAPLYDEFQSLREANASPDRWDAWVKKVERVQSELVPDLEATAGPAPHKLARQHLLFALRDKLPLLLEDSRTSPGRTEHELQEHLETAKALIAGDPPPPPRELPDAEPITPMEG